MIVEVELDGKKATTDGKGWTTNDRYLGALLRHYASPESVYGSALPGYSYVPDMALAMAHIAQEKIPGLKITKRPPTTSDKGLIL